jgi:hypothetical protein
MKYLTMLFSVILFKYSYLFTELQLEDTTTNLEKFTKNWSMKHSSKDEISENYEYVQDGEMIQNWSELITMTRYFNNSSSPMDWYTRMTEMFKQGKNGENQYQEILSINKDYILIKRWEKDYDQEWIKYQKIGNDLYFIHYTTKKKIPNQEWIEFVKGSSFKPSTSSKKISPKPPSI